MKFAVVLMVVFSAIGQQPTSRSTERARTGNSIQDPVVDYYDSIADYFRNSPRAVMAIRQKGIPDMEIPAVLLIARRSSASPNQVIAARKNGKAWNDIAKENGVKAQPGDFVKEANYIFLSGYHGRPMDQVREMHAKGMSFVDINQEFRRSGKIDGPKP